jgi:hypothetical protein
MIHAKTNAYQCDFNINTIVLSNAKCAGLVLTLFLRYNNQQKVDISPQGLVYR